MDLLSPYRSPISRNQIFVWDEADLRVRKPSPKTTRHLIRQAGEQNTFPRAWRKETRPFETSMEF